VPVRNEVWVTTPRDQSIRVLDGTTLAQVAAIKFDGAPEGFAVDATRGRFYTNLEDKDLTLAIDLASRATVATWHPACGEEGPHGIRLLEKEGLLIVACDAKIEVLDVGHDGHVVSELATGAGVDDVDYDPATRRVFVGGAAAATLTIASLSPAGALASAAVIPTAKGARNGVVGAGGRVYLAHSRPGEIVVVAPAP
jgi:DNA-binding beta-propeller fold protein YncE